MIGTIIKLAILIVVVLVGLKLFAPKVYEDTTSKISQETGIDKSTIDSNINKATHIAIESADKITDESK